MEIPDLVRQELGDEAVRSGVNLGDEDVVCFTPTRTLVYRGEGLLSDEKVEVYPHDFERLAVSEGRRKAKFSLVYVDEKLELTVPLNRGDAVLERLIEGKLSHSGVLDENENVTGVFRFSELTLVVTDGQLLKHLGGVTWGADFEQFSFEELTGLQFEEGSVATAIVIAFGDRPERIKAPSEQAPAVRKTLEESIFEYHEVGSLEELNAAVGPEPEEDAESSDGLGLASGIDPLVSDDADDATPTADDAAPEQAPRQSTAEQAISATAEQSTADAEMLSQPGGDGADESDTDIAALESQIAELTEAIETQNEQIQRQERTIKQLIKELRQGR